MKNKKLFAILTLLCFMMTLMPVAAFAADATSQAKLGEPTVMPDGSLQFVTVGDLWKVNKAGDVYTLTGGVVVSGKNIPNGSIVVDELYIDATGKDGDTVNGANVYKITQADKDAADAKLAVATTETAWADLVANVSTDTLDAFVAAQDKSPLTGDDAEKAAFVAANALNFDKVSNLFAAEKTYDAVAKTQTAANVRAFKAAYAKVTPADFAVFVGNDDAEKAAAVNTAKTLDEVKAIFTTDGTTPGVPGTGDVAIDKSAFESVDGDTTVKVVEKAGEQGVANIATFKFRAIDAHGNETNQPLSGNMYVWAVDEDGNVSSALQIAGVTGATKEDSSEYRNSYKFTGVQAGAEIKVYFASAGKYTVYAGIEDKATSALSNMQYIGGKANANKITVSGVSVDPEEAYSAKVNKDSGDNYSVTSEGVVKAADAAKGQELGTLTIQPNNVETDNIDVYFYSKDKVLTGTTVSISTDSGNIAVNKDSAKLVSQGKLQFKVSASREGKYNIYLEVDGIQYVLKVVSGNTAASAIETVNQPKAPRAQYDNDTKIRFRVTDVNGNLVKEATNGAAPTDKGMSGIKANKTTGKYIVLTEKPSASTMESSDLSLKYNVNKETYDLVTPSFDAEGTYSVKVILDNGAVATATWEVKKFGTPVELRIGYDTTTVELGGKITAGLDYVDANGVEKKATDADFAATGYAVEKVDGNTITVKSDEKYVGAKITVTAASSRYNLVSTKELTVAEGASAIKFADKTAEVNVNNKIVWNVVDSSDNKVALGSNNAVSIEEIKYIVLDKPEGAKVSTYDATIKSDLISKGEGRLALTSDKVGNVTVQAILKARYTTETTGTTEAVNQVKYYTGTQIFAVGNGSVGDVVVMSIGSNEIIVNDAKATIDAAPMVQNDRTYVPFRALAEAFGAEVAYDEATQAVTAELNGVKVVMTIGSATYTVNDAEKTMDVAPFINGSRTMVPVRFVAEAFGIKVIPTYDENGATADILFNL